MLIPERRGWEVPERVATPEAVAPGRRAILAGAAAAIAAPALADDVPGAVPRNPKFEAGRAITAEKDATTYNNYNEFSDDKDLWREAQALKQRPWSIRFDGLVKQPRTVGVDELLKQVSLEERAYRHRCVEVWGKTVPWTGFPLSDYCASPSRSAPRNSSCSRPRRTRRCRACGRLCIPGRISRP
jgi:methionine sulfoxide reductase catalytic subunit